MFSSNFVFLLKEEIKELKEITKTKVNYISKGDVGSSPRGMLVYINFGRKALVPKTTSPNLACTPKEDLT